MTQWIVPRLFPGQVIACVASGPSLTQEDVDFLRGRCKVIVVNDGYRMAPWADVLYAADGHWWKIHQGVPSFARLKVTVDTAASKKWGLKCINVMDRPGLSFDPGRLHWGKNGGYQALNLAFLMAAATVLLLGYDMRRSQAGKLHWFGDHPKPLRNTDSPHASWIDAFNTIPRLHPKLEIINCSRDSALNCFPRADLHDWFAARLDTLAA